MVRGAIALRSRQGKSQLQVAGKPFRRRAPTLGLQASWLWDIKSFISPGSSSFLGWGGCGDNDANLAVLPQDSITHPGMPLCSRCWLILFLRSLHKNLRRHLGSWWSRRLDVYKMRAVSPLASAGSSLLCVSTCEREVWGSYVQDCFLCSLSLISCPQLR